MASPGVLETKVLILSALECVGLEVQDLHGLDLGRQTPELDSQCARRYNSIWSKKFSTSISSIYGVYGKTDLRFLQFYIQFWKLHTSFSRKTLSEEALKATGGVY